jgi:glycosyltransferase involved in cell wall biosynthesis
MITVILTKYKRPHLLEGQFMSLRNQTLKPDEILVCDNSLQNLGVWARFSMALNAKSDFICIIDDDTIPGTKWLENCYNEFQIKEGLYGTCGYLFNSNTHYENNYLRHGWCNPNESILKVDYVVHNWFFKRDWLKYFWSDIRDPKYWLCGEDMNFSYQLQKQGISTFIPPHPKDDQSLWGSIKGWEYGTDNNSLWELNPDNFKSNMFEFFDNQIKRGWKLQYELRD